MILRVVLFFVEHALALGHADAGSRVTHHVQGGDQHLDGAVDGQDQGVGKQGLVIDEAHTGQDGEEDDSPRAGSGRRAHRGQQGQQGDDHQLHGREVVARAARDEDRGDHLHDGGAIHVDGHAQGQDKGSNGIIHAHVLGADFDAQGQGSCTGRSGETEDRHIRDLLDERERVQLCAHRHDGRVAHQQEHEQQDHGGHHIDQRRLEVIHAVDGKGTGQQHKDCKRCKLGDDEVQENDHHVVHFPHQAAHGGGAALAQHIHAQAGGYRQENGRKHRAVAAKGRDDVGRNDVQHHIQRVGAGRTGSLGQALDVCIEQAHRERGIAHNACQQQCQERTQQEPEEGLGSNPSHGTGIRDAANGQRDGGEHHRDDDQLQRLDEQLPDDIEDAERLLGSLCRDILEQQIVDGLPECTVAGSIQLLAQHHERKARDKAANQRHCHFLCQCRAAVILIIFHTSPHLFPHKIVCFVRIRPMIPHAFVGCKAATQVFVKLFEIVLLLCFLSFRSFPEVLCLFCAGPRKK